MAEMVKAGKKMGKKKKSGSLVTAPVPDEVQSITYLTLSKSLKPKKKAFSQEVGNEDWGGKKREKKQ